MARAGKARGYLKAGAELWGWICEETLGHVRVGLGKEFVVRVRLPRIVRRPLQQTGRRMTGRRGERGGRARGTGKDAGSGKVLREEREGRKEKAKKKAERERRRGLKDVPGTKFRLWGGTRRLAVLDVGDG